MTKKKQRSLSERITTILPPASIIIKVCYDLYAMVHGK